MDLKLRPAMKRYVKGVDVPGVEERLRSVLYYLGSVTQWVQRTQEMLRESEFTKMVDREVVRWADKEIEFSRAAQLVSDSVCVGARTTLRWMEIGSSISMTIGAPSGLQKSSAHGTLKHGKEDNEGLAQKRRGQCGTGLIRKVSTFDQEISAFEESGVLGKYTCSRKKSACL